MLSYGHGHTDYYPGVDAFDVIVQAYCEDCDYTFETEVSVERTEWQTECPICESKCKGKLDE